MGTSRESEAIVNCHSQQVNKGFGHATVGHATVGHATEFVRSIFKAPSHEMSSNNEKVGK